MKINAALVQIGHTVGYIERALHIVSNNNAGDSKSLLQATNQSIDAVRNNGIKPRGRLIVENA
jgi:hypothetical protein